MTKVVIANTSASELKGHKTGVWLEELAVPYYLFRAKGYQVLVASIKGGEIPIDGASLQGDFYVEAAKKFINDEQAMEKLNNSIPVADIDFKTVDAIYLTGGHGTCVDYITSPDLKNAIELLYANDKVVAADCHGPIGLANCVKPDGTPLVAGKTVTGFSDSEEDAVQLTELVPFLIEAKFKEQGANYEKADDWNPKVCVDGKLVTGQNPQSSDLCAKAVVKLLG
ncbi:ThiJ/PfpI family-like [Fragilaria crotonensis]|nr:ThiJ/PfpI family-like [Fragilaria crotonensis]